MTRHGMSGTRIYRIWQGMIRRTTAPKCPQFKRYGSLGICKGWLTFEGFLTWATSHGYSDGLSIDRIDNDKGVLSVELPVGYSETAGEKHVVERPRQSRWPRVRLAYRGKRGVWTHKGNS